MNKNKIKEALKVYGMHYGGMVLFLVGLVLLIRFGWDKWYGYVIGVVGLILFGIDNHKYSKYLDIITRTGELAVDGIAVQAGESVETTKKMLNEMLKKHILNGWIDEEKMELRLTEWPGNSEDDEEGDKFFHPKIKYTHAKDVICPNCGAKVRIGVKKQNKCDYCGKKIKLTTD